MLRIRRCFAIDGSGFRVDSHLGLATDHRAVAIATSPGCVVDGRLLPREPSPERAYLYLLLEGELILHAARRRVVAPAFVLAEDRAALHVAEQSRAEGPQRALALQLDRALLDHRGAARSGPLDERARAAASVLHHALSTPAPWEEFAAAHGALFDLLRSSLPSIRTPALERPTDRHARFADALSAALSKVGERPAQIDLAGEGDTSERTARRLFREIADRHGWVYDRWQSLRRQWSTAVACLLLVSTDARPEVVARQVGFASLTSLHHAMSRAGLPPPRELQALAAQLRHEAAAALLDDAIAKSGQ